MFTLFSAGAYPGEDWGHPPSPLANAQDSHISKLIEFTVNCPASITTASQVCQNQFWGKGVQLRLSYVLKFQRDIGQKLYSCA